MRKTTEALSGQLGRAIHIDNNRFRGVYFDIIMPLNMAAVVAAYDAADAIEESPLYKQRVKREVNVLLKILDTYNLRLKQTYVTKYNLYTDYVTLFGERLGGDVERYKNGIVLLIGKLGQRDYIQVKAQILLAAHLAENAAELHRKYIVHARAVGVDSTDIDSVYYGTTKPIAMQLQKIAGLLIKFSREQMTEYQNAPLHEAGIKSVNKHCLSNGDLDYRTLAGLAADALDLNKDTYGEEAERTRAELARLDKSKEDAIKAVERKAEELDKENMIRQLSDKFIVKKK